jgi:hypothetical protein
MVITPDVGKFVVVVTVIVVAMLVNATVKLVDVGRTKACVVDAALA